MKKRILAIFLALTMIFSTAAILSGCDGGGDVTAPTGDAVTITFWHPITGPDAKYMQDLINNFNKEYDGKIFVKASAQAEAAHYDKITNSFTDNSTADICMIHKSRVSQYTQSGKLLDMTALLAANGIKQEDYVGDSWSACEVGGKMYAMPYDTLPILLYYNRELIPDGYTEADILSDDFTVEKMLEMAVAAYDASNERQIKYGIAFNYGYTEEIFLAFLTQFGQEPVSVDDPYTALFDNESGKLVAEAIMSMPFTNAADGNSICSPSGADHLDIFSQGRALFTLDGIWSAPDACTKVPGRLDAGVALLPKVNNSVNRTVFSEGHVFAMFNTANGGTVDEAKKEAVGTFMKYLSDNSADWCKGGKVAVRSEVANNSDYLALEWGYLSTKLDSIVSPVKVHTFNAIISRIGNHVSDLCEGRATDVAKELADAASEGEALAKELK